MVLQTRIQAFATLGSFLASNDASIQSVIEKAEHLNPWYTQQSVKQQLNAFAENLTLENLNNWLKDYPDFESEKVVGLVLAGNLPLVGFHDILCVLISGFKAQIKVSSDDAELTTFVLQKLIEIQPEFASRIELTERLKDFDLVIATGSNNSSRYFEYYFGKKPHIIRKNRNSIAVLTGEETPKELQGLGHDIFDYFGLGCRSVSKIFIPENYPVKNFFEAIESFSDIKDHLKYNNNYDFNKSIYLINKNEHFDNGFLLLKEDNSIASPLAVIHYERYKDLRDVTESIQQQQSGIQCVVSSHSLDIQLPVFPFGESQRPALDDYADAVNTLDFLESNR